ncbi:MAG: VOC family protein [Cyclobacteriaceae bacterium]
MKINGLDHIALRVPDPEATAQWYEKALGLRRYQHKKIWGPYPIMMLAGKSGLALFPATTDQPDSKHKGPGMFHFAFNVDLVELSKVQHQLEQFGLKVTFEDHHYFHSIYFSDPNGLIVELTALTIEGSEFYD